MIDSSNTEKSRRMKVLKTHVKMLFSCFGSKAQAPPATSSTTARGPPTGATTPAALHQRDRKRGDEEVALFDKAVEEAEEVDAGRRRAKMRRRKRKMVVVGDGECGKTCLLQRFCRDTYNLNGYLPTVFDTDVVDVHVDDTTVELIVTDTAGQEDYDRLRPYSYPDTDVVVVCFSIDNPDSLENVRLTWVPEVRHFCGNVPVLLVGNKMDLRGQGEVELHRSTATSEDFLDLPECSPSASLIKQGPVKESSARKLADEVGAVGYWETSALLDQGVTEVFQAASRAALGRLGGQSTTVKGGQRRERPWRQLRNDVGGGGTSWRGLSG
ncbi:ras-like GTP-binding protein rhoA [Babylonia areolata]|uniref:ras-like GTP-binding protein rhoA n=1 Tax=Babylonia areolata TaxID=304850 RepID=UPI003FD55C63